MPEARKYVKLDSNESIFFERELEHVKAKSYDVKYKNLRSREIVPTSFDGDPADDTITYYQFDQVGSAKIIRDYANDFRKVNLLGKKFSVDVFSIGASYDYSFMEVRKAAKVGRPLEVRKANAARRAVKQKENSLTYLGDAALGLGGFLNNANVPVMTYPHTGAWASLTADQILDNLNALANQPFNSTKGIETADTILLPLDVYTLISTKRIPDTNITIKKFFMENTPFIENVTYLQEVEGAGAGGSDRPVAYRRDPDAVTFEVTQEYETLPVDEHSTTFEVPVHMRVGGTIFYYPLSAVYGDIV